MYKDNRQHIDEEIMRYVSVHLDADIESLIEGKDIKMGKKSLPIFDEYLLYRKICNNIEENRVHSILMPFLKWIAVLLLLFNVGYFSYQHFNQPVATMCEVVVSKGEKMMVMLSDGTRVWLNADSKLIYPDVFLGKKRQIALSGEAYFEVKNLQNNPFWVTAGGAKIKVTGTCFNVTAYPSDDCVVTTLDEGSISIGHDVEHAPTYAMTPGQTAILDKDKGVFKISVNDNYKEASDWRNDRLVFRNAKLEQILNVLSRKFDVSFTITNDKIRSFTYNLSCKGNDLGKVLETIQQITPVVVEKKTEYIYIVK